MLEFQQSLEHEHFSREAHTLFGWTLTFMDTPRFSPIQKSLVVALGLARSFMEPVITFDTSSSAADRQTQSIHKNGHKTS